jgi:hypothetical protein
VEQYREIAVAVLNSQTNLQLKMKIKCNATVIEAFRISSLNTTGNFSEIKISTEKVSCEDEFKINNNQFGGYILIMNNATRSNFEYKLEDLNASGDGGEGSNTGLIIGIIAVVAILVGLGIGLYVYNKRKLRAQLEN